MTPDLLKLLDTLTRIALPIFCSVLFLMTWNGERTK
jgi:hypothetical protein